MGERSSGRACGGVVTWRDLADGGGVPAVALVAVGGLHEDGAVAEALCEDLPADVVQPHASPWRDSGQTGPGCLAPHSGPGPAGLTQGQSQPGSWSFPASPGTWDPERKPNPREGAGGARLCS